MTTTSESTTGWDGNGDEDTLEDLTAQEALKITLKEIADVRREILMEIRSGHKELGESMLELKGTVQAMAIKLDQNLLTMMKRGDDLEERVEALEAMAA